MEKMSVEELAVLLRTAILRNGKTWTETAIEVLKAFEESEDPYEYNIERTSGVTGKTYLYFGLDGWDDNRKSVKQEFDELLVAESTRLMNNKYRFVKRRKAGRIEDV